MADIVCSFLTHRKGAPLTYGIVVDERGCGGARSASFRDLAVLANQHPGACAYGKIVILRNDGIFSFQAKSTGEVVAAFCGNSTAAAIGTMGGEGHIRTRVHGAAPQPYDVSAWIEGDSVTQEWIVPAHAVETHTWRGRAISCLATLNEYAIVAGPLPRNLAPEAARHELLGPAQSGKLAVIGGTADCPIVEFHNANGKHGALPQTGLATIALAARAVPWLRDRLPHGELRYPTKEGFGTARLPTLRSAANGGIAIEMPRISVDVKQLALELVA